jgi:hypothetical protein
VPYKWYNLKLSPNIPSQMIDTFFTELEALNQKEKVPALSITKEVLIYLMLCLFPVIFVVWFGTTGMLVPFFISLAVQVILATVGIVILFVKLFKTKHLK